MHIYVPIGSENSDESTTYTILPGNLLQTITLETKKEVGE
jgi:hypothetical protein